MPFYDDLSSGCNGIAAISDEGAAVTYAEMELLTGELCDRIDRRALVFCLCENSIGSLVGYISCLRRRAVPLLLAKEIKPELLEALLSLYKPQLVYLPASATDPLLHMERIHSGLGYVLLRTNYPTAYPMHDELALLLTTSGSTGSPKLVRLSYRNVSSNAASIAQYLELTDSERPITTLAMNYTYGLSVINSHLQVGATLLMTVNSLMERRFWDFFKAQRPTSLAGVPYTYEMLKKLRFFGMQLPTVRTMTQAGGKLSLDLNREVAQFAAVRRIRFFVMYGQTEATARMGYLAPELAISKCGSIGKAIPGGDFSLVDAHGRLIEEPEVVGELIFRGDNVGMGYAERGEDLAKGNEWGGVLATGDLAFRDRDGLYYIAGRKKRFLKLFGTRIHLDDAERMIKIRFDGAECACCGVDDRMTIFLTDAGLCKSVRDYIAAETGLNPLAFVARAVDHIPKSEAGKILYAELEKLM